MTRHPEPPHRPGRRRRRLLAAGLATALALTGCTAETNGGDGEASKDGGSDSGPAKKSSDGASIEVVESAVTATEDSSGEAMASYAVIVENPSQDVATATRLEVRLLDSSGDPVKDLVADTEAVTTSVNLVMPGGRQAVTNATYTEGGTVDSVEVSVSGTGWYSGDDKRFSAVTTSKVSAGPSKITFRATSDYDSTLFTVPTYAVLRDADGKLLGGTAPNDAKPTSYEPGSTDGTIEVPSGAPPDWDADATEVYVDPLVDP